DLVKLPVHSGRALVVNLHPVNADVARARFWVARVHIRQSNETPAVLWPAFEDRKIIQRKSVSLADLVHDFLSRRFAHRFWARMEQMNSLFEQRPTLTQVGWWFCFQNKLNFLCDICDVRHL